MYKLLSTGTRRFYHEYTWKASTVKVSPSETYPLYGMLLLVMGGLHDMDITREVALITMITY